MKYCTEKGMETEQKIYDFIVKYVETHCYSPSFREIADGIGAKSTSTIHRHVNRMLNSGRLETDAGIDFPRTIRVPGYKFVKV